jgi:hypothetical protein
LSAAVVFQGSPTTTEAFGTLGYPLRVASRSPRKASSSAYRGVWDTRANRERVTLGFVLMSGALYTDMEEESTTLSILGMSCFVLFCLLMVLGLSVGLYKNSEYSLGTITPSAIVRTGRWEDSKCCLPQDPENLFHRL